MTDTDSKTEADSDEHSDESEATGRTVTATASPVDVDSEQTIGQHNGLSQDELLDVRVLTQEAHRLWGEREKIRTEQPTEIGPNGEPQFTADADDVAVRRFQQCDEQLARLLLENQGLVIRYLKQQVPDES